jgi:hypothetical protein
MNLKSRAVRSLLLVTLIFAVTGCSNWLDDATRALSTARRGVQSADDLARGGPSFLDDSTRTLDDFVRNAPDNPNSEESRILSELLQTKVAVAQAKLAVLSADSTAAALPQDAADVAAAATSQADAQTTLSDVSRIVLEDVACDVAADHLFPKEKDELEAEDQQRVVPDVVEATAESITNFADRELARLVGGTHLHRFVAWQQYADSVLKKRERYVNGVEGFIESPTFKVSRAYYHYARLCLKPPR